MIQVYILILFKKGVWNIPTISRAILSESLKTNTAFHLHLGDLVYDSPTTQFRWDGFSRVNYYLIYLKGLEIISKSYPFISVVGNHESHCNK